MNKTRVIKIATAVCFSVGFLAVSLMITRRFDSLFEIVIAIAVTALVLSALCMAFIVEIDSHELKHAEARLDQLLEIAMAESKAAEKEANNP